MLEFLGFGAIMLIIFAIYEIRKHGVTQAQIVTDLKNEVSRLVARIDNMVKK